MTNCNFFERQKVDMQPTIIETIKQTTNEQKWKQGSYFSKTIELKIMKFNS